MDLIDNLIALSIYCAISALLLAYTGILKFTDPVFFGFILLALIIVYVFRKRIKRVVFEPSR